MDIFVYKYSDNGLGQNIKALREQKGLLQKQVATEIGLGISHYNKIENGQREASVEMLDKLAKFYGVSIDQIGHPDNEVPTEVVVEDKTPDRTGKINKRIGRKG